MDTKQLLKDLPLDLDSATLHEVIDIAGIVQTLIATVKVLVARVKALFVSQA